MYPPRELPKCSLFMSTCLISSLEQPSISYLCCVWPILASVWRFCVAHMVKLYITFTLSSKEKEHLYKICWMFKKIWSKWVSLIAAICSQLSDCKKCVSKALYAQIDVKESLPQLCIRQKCPCQMEAVKKWSQGCADSIRENILARENT